MKLLLVCGPWGSGTSAVAGVLARLGMAGFGPYFPIKEQRWSCSYELVPFRDALLPFMSEEAASLRAGIVPSQALPSLRKLRACIENQELGPYDGSRPIFLKYPLSAMVIPEICSVFDTKLVYVLRPFEDIERTRQRRGWGTSLGEQGARIIYWSMFQFLIERTHPIILLRYPELLRDPTRFAAELATFAEVGANAKDIQKAAAFIEVPARSDRQSIA